MGIGLIVGDFLKALGQLSDRRFRSVLGKGIGLTLLLLIGVYLAFAWFLQWVTPDSFTLPLIGEITWVDNLLSGASLLLMLVLSVFLMVPVASAFTSLFLDEVADAVEAEHYPHLPRATRVGVVDGLRDGASFLGVLIGANIVAVVAYLLMPPAAPFIFIGLNGFLLGREYFQLVALRRLGRDGAKAARARHAARIWIAGILMAAPLTVPILNLLVPVLGVATFTHLFHRLEGPSGRTSPDRAH